MSAGWWFVIGQAVGASVVLIGAEIARWIDGR